MNIFDLDTPALVVDLDRLERNIAGAAKAAEQGGKRLRPHTKTHKTPEVARMQVEAGADGLTVAKLGEAEVYADSGFDDIFIANEIVGSAKVDRLICLAERCKIIVGVDSLESAEPISKAAAAAGLDVAMRMEVDTGHHRAGIRAVEDAVNLGIKLHRMPGLTLDGVFTHEGHVYKAEAAEVRTLCFAAAGKLRRIREELGARGVPLTNLSVGSTPSLSEMSQEDGITELRPGVYVFGDAMQVGFGMNSDDCALSLLATVVSRPDGQTAIIDSGSKALSGDRGTSESKYGSIMDHPEAALDWVSEEHGHIELSHSSWNPRVGDHVRILPYHACATTNMHSEIYAARGDSVEATWTIAARGRFR